MTSSSENSFEDRSSDLESKTFEDNSSPITTQSSGHVLNSHRNRSTAKNGYENQQPTSSSSDASDEDSDDYEDCEEHNDVEYDAGTFEKTESLYPFQKMSHVIMFPQSHLSTRDVSLMVMAYSIRFHCTYKARDALFEMCKIFAGDTFKTWNTSKYVMSQLYDPPDEVVKLCFLCEKCCDPLLPPVSKRKFKKCHVQCTCGSEYNLTTQSSNYIIAVDLKYQLEILLQDEEIKIALLKGIQDVKLRENDSTEIRDVYDGLLYKNLQEKYSDVSHLVTLNFSTDGAPVCNSGKKSFWPLQVILNELPPKLRFKYPLLAGLSIDKKEPSAKFMNAYMKQFINQLEPLAEKGLEISDENGKPITVKLVPLCCPVDSVARPILQNRVQYNGYFGCSWCYENGIYDSNAMRYPVRENDAKTRTNESHRKDCEKKMKSPKTTQNGVKGFSVLLTLLTFDMVWGFPVDYLHSELLGVVKYLWDVWIETKIVTAEAVRELNNRLLKMTPPHEIHRLPRSMNEKAKWKASEWRSWLLFYSFVCLQGLIPAEVLDHYALLVESIFILLQDSISEMELRACEEKLLIFVAKCQEMFGNSVMTFNIHSLLHLVHSVRMTGPLWTTSTFPFESAIFYLKQAITGPKGLYDQIAKRTLLQLTFGYTCKKLASSETCVRFCEDIFAYSGTKNAMKTIDKVLLLGSLGQTEDGGHLFARCIYKLTVFHSTKYTSPTKTNDTFVMLASKEIGEIIHFTYKNCNTYVSLNMFRDVPGELGSVSHIKKVERTNSVVTVLIEFIDKKLVFMEVSGSSYVARLPNTVEIQ